MNTEYEVKVLEIDHDAFVSKLESLGAKKISDAMQERYIYDLIPASPKKWIRLRTNGKKTTITLKDLQAETIDGMKEMEIEVNSFEDAHKLLLGLGYKSKGFQQNKRVQYILDDVEIDLDHWPHIPEYMEIEGRDEESVKNMIEKLGVDKKNVTTMDVDSIYKHYGYDSIHDLSFDEEEL